MTQKAINSCEAINLLQKTYLKQNFESICKNK